MPSKSLKLMLAVAASTGILAGCGRHRQQTAQGDPFLHSSPNHSLAATAEKAHSDLQRNVRQSANKIDRHLDEIPKPHQTINRAAVEAEDPFLIADENPFRPTGSKSAAPRSTAKPQEPPERTLPGGVAPAIDVADNARSDDFDASPFAPEPKTSSIKQTSATTEAAVPTESAEMTENPFETSAPAPRKPSPATASVVETKRVSAPESGLVAAEKPASDDAEFEWAKESPRATTPARTASAAEPVKSEPPPAKSSNPFEEDFATSSKPVGWATAPNKPQSPPPSEPRPKTIDDDNPFADFNKRKFDESEEKSPGPTPAATNEASPIPTENSDEPAFDAAVEETAEEEAQAADDEAAGKFEFRSAPISQMSYTVEAKRPAPKKPAPSPAATGWKARKPVELPLPTSADR